jgi:hypothetical protein
LIQFVIGYKEQKGAIYYLCLFLSPGDSGRVWTQTHNLGMMSQAFYLLAIPAAFLIGTLYHWIVKKCDPRGQV